MLLLLFTSKPILGKTNFRHKKIWILNSGLSIILFVFTWDENLSTLIDKSDLILSKCHGRNFFDTRLTGVQDKNGVAYF